MFNTLKLLKKSKKDIVGKAVRWLKERGINPHLSRKDIVETNILKILMSSEHGYASFDMHTGKVSIPSFWIFNKPLQEIFTIGIIEHEAFHRGDYLYKFGGTKKGRRRIYRKWKKMEELLQEIEKHKKYMDSEHPLQQAILKLDVLGCNSMESLLKLWSREPETFKKMLTLATALRIAEKKNINVDRETLYRTKKELKEYFVQTPVKQDEKTKYFALLSEVPAYIITFHRMYLDLEKGLRLTKEIITEEDRYFRGTELEETAKAVVDNYRRLAEILKKAGYNDEEVVKGILHIHKSIDTPEDLERLLEEEEKIIKAAKAVKTWVGTEDIREGLAAQRLGKMDETFKKFLKAGKRQKNNR